MTDPRLTYFKIQSLGGLTGIVISHPHYYTTYVTWARHFKCPVYVSIEDMSWMTRQIVSDVDRHLIRESYATIIPGITAIKCGGHFPGSLVLHWTEDHGILFIADTIVTVPVSFLDNKMSLVETEIFNEHLERFVTNRMTPSPVLTLPHDTQIRVHIHSCGLYQT